MTSIYDIDFADINSFLTDNDIVIPKNKIKAYQLAQEGIVSGLFQNYSDIIIDWIIAHNLYNDKIELKTYKLSEINNMSDSRLKGLYMLLSNNEEIPDKVTMKKSIINILKFLHKLDFEYDQPIAKSSIKSSTLPTINPEIKVGDVGTYTRGGRVGRQYWDGFVVTKIITPGKKVEVKFDIPIRIGKEEYIQIENPNGPGWIRYLPKNSDIRILEYRRPGRWMFKGVPAKDMSGSISFGEKRTEIEQG
jgi:hypothetical protein